MRRTLTLLILGCALTACAGSGTLSERWTGTRNLTIEHDGLMRTYGLHVPESGSRRRMPLVVALHCYGIDGPVFMQRTGWIEKSDEHGFLLLFPDATGQPPEWNEGIGLNPATREVDDEGFVIALIERIMAEYPVDPRRVYLTGHSSGAFFSHLLAARHADLIAAIATVAGQGTRELIDALAPVHPVAVVHLHALDDEAVAFTGGPAAGVPCPPVMTSMTTWSRINGAAAAPDTVLNVDGLLGLEWRAPSRGADVRFYRYDTGGHSWPTAPVPATDLIWEFFSAQSRR